MIKKLVAISLVGVACLTAVYLSNPSLVWIYSLREPEYYAEKLVDKEFEWYGPRSHAVRIPSLHAAAALAYIGDPAVPFLLDAVENPEIDILSLKDALSEIGLPVDRFCEELFNRDSSGLREWWKENQMSTIVERSQIHREHGLGDL